MGKLSDEFFMPPFSVLNAREGAWQKRKKEWLSLGIKSELGRGGAQAYTDYEWCEKNAPDKVDAPPYQSKRGLAQSTGQDLMKGENKNFGKRLTWVAGDRAEEDLDDVSRKILAAQPQSGTSIFDPVVCELVYRWFCPPGGHILDPFAGGSVRGIVAAHMGFKYTGIDLSSRQIEANRIQATTILSEAQTPESDFVEVKISMAMAYTPFHGCTPKYISEECHASCCQSSTSPSGTMITIHPTEELRMKQLGGTTENGFLQPVNKRCPFKQDDNLCRLHSMGFKPFGCVASPFTLNKNNTLIVRNRYKLLKCYNQGEKLPAYIAFRASIDRIFGKEESTRVCGLLDKKIGDVKAKMPIDSWKKLKENDAIKHGEPCKWIVGDSREIQTACSGSYDLIFSCPPYADLEVYSDDPKDLSTLEYPAFLRAYQEIIKASLSMLKPNRFACFVVGDIRDELGFYRGFVSDTIQAFQSAGAILYNEAILVTAVGSLPIRVRKQFSGYRKLGKTHQNVLVFYKGNIKAIKSELGAVDLGDKFDQTGIDAWG